MEELELNIYIFDVATKAVLSQDIKAERKSNPLKNNPDCKERVQHNFIYTNNTKNPKDNNINISSKN